MEAVFIIGLNAILRAEINPVQLRPLWDELMSCVWMVRDPSVRDQSTGGYVITGIVSPDDIEEIKTRLWLRQEVLSLHLGFSIIEEAKRLLSAISRSTEVSPST